MVSINTYICIHVECGSSPPENHSLQKELKCSITCHLKPCKVLLRVENISSLYDTNAPVIPFKSLTEMTL